MYAYFSHRRKNQAMEIEAANERRTWVNRVDPRRLATINELGLLLLAGQRDKARDAAGVCTIKEMSPPPWAASGRKRVTLAPNSAAWLHAAVRFPNLPKLARELD